MHSFICFCLFFFFNVTWVHILSLGGSPHCTYRYMHLFPLCCHPANLVLNMPGYISRKKIHYQYLTGDEKQELCNCAFLWYFLKLQEIVELGKLWLKSQICLSFHLHYRCWHFYLKHASARFRALQPALLHRIITPPPTSSPTTTFSKKSDYYAIHSGFLLIYLWVYVLSLLGPPHCIVHLSLYFSILFNLCYSALI